MAVAAQNFEKKKQFAVVRCKYRQIYSPSDVSTPQLFNPRFFAAGLFNPQIFHSHIYCLHL